MVQQSSYFQTEMLRQEASIKCSKRKKNVPKVVRIRNYSGEDHTVNDVTQGP